MNLHIWCTLAHRDHHRDRCLWRYARGCTSGARGGRHRIPPPVEAHAAAPL